MVNSQKKRYERPYVVRYGGVGLLTLGNPGSATETDYDKSYELSGGAETTQKTVSAFQSGGDRVY